MLLSASSTGEIKLYRLPDMVQRWTAGQQSGEACCCWQAHPGPVYCLVKVRAGTDTVFLSGGEDGYVRGWRLPDVLKQLLPQQQQQQQQAASAQAVSSSMQVELRPCLEVRLPRAESPLAAISLPPAVQALAVSQGAGDTATTLFVGCSDGGVHAVDLASGVVSQPSSPAGGHAAAVLAMDAHGPSSCLATGSEDGTIRLWDARGGSVGGCSRILDATGGREVGAGAEALRCLRNPHVSCLRFEPSGCWLLCGQGGAGGLSGGGSLGLWSLGMAQRARHVVTSFVPQALVVQPSDLLAAGSEAALSRYSLGLEGPVSRTPLATRSAFGLDVHPLTGAVAVGGCGASLELLSKYGKKTGGVYFQSDED